LVASWANFLVLLVDLVVVKGLFLLNRVPTRSVPLLTRIDDQILVLTGAVVASRACLSVSAFDVVGTHFLLLFEFRHVVGTRRMPDLGADVNGGTADGAVAVGAHNTLNAFLDGGAAAAAEARVAGDIKMAFRAFRHVC